MYVQVNYRIVQTDSFYLTFAIATKFCCCNCSADLWHCAHHHHLGHERADRVWHCAHHHHLGHCAYQRNLIGHFKVIFSMLYAIFYRSALYAGVVFMIVMPSVRLSVCSSVTRVYCEKTNESSADILTPYEREFHLVFWHKEWLVGIEVPFYVKFGGKLSLSLQKRRFSIHIRS